MSINFNQKLILFSIGILIIVLYIFAVKPILDSHTSLISRINTEKELSQYLKSVNISINGQAVYPVLTNSKALSLIQSHLGVPQNIATNSNGITSTITRQNFDKLKNGLYVLKNQYGVVVVNAKISKVADGLIDAILIFTHP